METSSPDSAEERILVVAPLGRDAELAASALVDAGMSATRCDSMDSLVSALRDGSYGAVLLAEEALAPGGVLKLKTFLAEQPPWADLPIVLLTSGGLVTDASREAADAFGSRGNVTLLERPIRVMTLTRTMQVALRARRRQYQVRDLLLQREQVLASIRDAFVIIDHGFRYTYVNPEAAELCQKPIEDMLGKCLWDLFPMVVGTEFELRLREAMTRRASTSFEWYSENVGGRWFNIRVHPSTTGLSLFTVEITARKELEAVLLESERRLHLALDSAELGMWYCDLPFDKINCDANCKNLFGLQPDEEFDISCFYSILHPDDRERTQMAIERSIADHTNYDIEYRAVLDDGTERWIHAMGRAFYRDDDNSPYRFDGVLIDISQRKLTELELERARKVAIEANQAKDRFLAALSHELRTPLTPVLMSVTALEEDPNLPAHVRADLEMIHRNVELEARLIDDLLDLTRITRGKLILHREAADLNELIRYAIATCCDAASGVPARAVFRDNATESHVFADAARLHQVLCNLLNNAVKFTPQQGSIEINSSNPEPGIIEISVADTGMGISAELLPRLFDAFEQGNPAVTRQFGGLGLGLAISKAIVDLHGGALRAESAGLGKGAVFTIRLATIDSPENVTPIQRQPNAEVTRPLQILLTEDHEATRKVLTRLLTRAGHTVQAAGSVSEALRLAERAKFDLLVSDLGLPDGTGSDVMRELRARYGMKGIALSGYGMEDDVKASTEAGFSMHLTKPVDWHRLESALHRISTPASKSLVDKA